MNKGVNTILAIIALIVGIVALLVAMGAYNRTGRDIGEVAQGTVQQTTERLRMQAGLFDLQTDLIAIQNDIEDNDITDDTQQLIEDVREQARRLNVDTDIQSQIAQLEAQVRDDSGEAVNTVNNILEELRLFIESGAR